jgi:hypothetical protein
MGLTGLDALSAMREEDERRGIDPTTFPVVEHGPPPVPPQPFYIPPFDTSSFRDPPAPVREPDPPLHTEDTETLPAKPKAKSRTPRLDAWRSEQLVAAPRGAA